MDANDLRSFNSALRDHGLTDLVCKLYTTTHEDGRQEHDLLIQRRTVTNGVAEYDYVTSFSCHGDVDTMVRAFIADLPRIRLFHPWL
jgi:hypothetical protein